MYIVFMSFFTDVTSKLWCLVAAVKLHNLMLHRLFKCPMEFFERILTGRILNIFSKDVDVLDNVLPMTLYWYIICVFAVKFSLFFNDFIQKTQKFYCGKSSTCICSNLHMVVINRRNSIFLHTPFLKIEEKNNF